MKGACFPLFILLLASCLAASCSSSGDDLGALSQSLEDRLTDALDFDSDVLRNGLPPAGQEGDSAPQLSNVEVPGGMAVETGFIFSLEGSYDDPAAVKKAVVFVHGASRHFVVDVLAYKDKGFIRTDLIGRLGADDKLVGKTFTFKVALQNDKGVTGLYYDMKLSIGEVVHDETLLKVSFTDDEYSESGRPVGNVSTSAPQIDAFTWPSEVVPGGAFRVNLRSSFHTPEQIAGVTVGTPRCSGHRKYLAKAVTMSGKAVSDSLVVLNGSVSEDVAVGDELVLIVALRHDSGELGVYRSLKMSVVETQNDGDESESEADFPFDEDGDPEADGDDPADGDLEEEAEPEDGDIEADELSEDEAEDAEHSELATGVLCHLHSGVVGAALEMQVGLQSLDKPIWSQDFDVLLTPGVQSGHDSYTSYEYSVESVRPGRYRALALIKSAAADGFIFPDSYYWASEGPLSVADGAQTEFNIWAAVPGMAGGVVEDISVAVSADVYPVNNPQDSYLPHVYALLDRMIPETLDLALSETVALRRISNGVNGYSVDLKSIPPGTYYLSMWIDRCMSQELSDDVLHIDWMPSIVVPQPTPAVLPTIPLNLMELNCPLAPGVLQIPEVIDMGNLPTTGGIFPATIRNNGTLPVYVRNQASTLPFASAFEVIMPFTLNPGAEVSLNFSVGSSSGGAYAGTFYLLVDDLMHPAYSSELRANLVK